MLQAEIIFFTESPCDFELNDKTLAQQWIAQLAEKHGHQIESINYIFCTDDYLKQVNIDYLQHDYYTDIITFDNSEEEGIIESDIFISIDRVKDNAQTLGISFNEELLRVLAHGLLHLVGFSDKTEMESQIMREKENEAITLYKTLET